VAVHGIVRGLYAGAALYIMVASRPGPSTVLGDHGAGGPEDSGGGACTGTVGSGLGSSDRVPYVARKLKPSMVANASRMACTWAGEKASGVRASHTGIWGEDGSGSLIQDGPSSCLTGLSKIRRWTWVYDGINVVLGRDFQIDRINRPN